MLWLTLFMVQNEMMSDSIDSILDDDQAEEETEELANQVISDVCFKIELFISFNVFPFMCISQASHFFLLKVLTHFFWGYSYYFLPMVRFWMRLVLM
jgi:hypothetical protein